MDDVPLEMTGLVNTAGTKARHRLRRIPMIAVQSTTDRGEVLPIGMAETRVADIRKTEERTELRREAKQTLKLKV